MCAKNVQKYVDIMHSDQTLWAAVVSSNVDRHQGAGEFIHGGGAKSFGYIFYSNLL